MSKLQEIQINNSYFIKQEFKQKAKAYHAPLPMKKQRVHKKGRSGKVRIFTEEEIFLYKMKNCPINLVC